jgi:hypothetical protein
LSSATPPGLCAYVESVGVSGPGLAGWTRCAAVLRGDAAYETARTVIPAPQLLPPAERRRTNATVKLALAVGLEAVQTARADARQLVSVFTSSGADGQNCHEICETLAGAERELSPTRFHNSVHNAAAGYWSIATGAMRACNVLCAHDASFTAGLLDAMTQLIAADEPVLLVSYDTQYPPPLHAKRPLPDAFGVALLLAPRPGPASMARLRLDLGPGEISRLALPALEALRISIPTARALPLLQALARGQGTVVLPYLPPLHLRLEVMPCG